MLSILQQQQLQNRNPLTSEDIFPKITDNISYYKITLTKNIVALQSFKH